MTNTLGTFTPYSTVTPLLSGLEDSASWAPPWDTERIQSYQKYEEIYWNNPLAFRLQTRDVYEQPIYVPNPRAIVDTTAHFLMKGMKLKAPNEADQLKLEKWLKREKFYAEFTSNKHSGCVRGDYIFHIIADPNKPANKRVSIKTVDPASYFPFHDEDDPDLLLGVDIVDQFIDSDLNPKVLRQRYRYVVVDGSRRVESSITLLEVIDWWHPTRRSIIREVMTPKLLSPEIETIPVYAFKNISWQGQPFGSSELRGFERLQASINQAVSDEDTALALEGLGVYATDAPQPTNDAGEREPWEISPGRVLEIPTGSKIERVSGVGSVKPFQDHLSYLTDAAYETSATFRPSAIDAQVAQSGIALAIKFLPTLAKSEDREREATDVLQQMFFDWAVWQRVYENQRMSTGEFEVEVVLGDKLPLNKVDKLNELNNMLDRKVISREFYREEMTRLFGYTFPDDIDKQIMDEQKEVLELQQQFAPVQPNGSGGSGVSDQSGVKNRTGQKKPNNSNNKGKTNESNGSEAKK